MTTMNCRDCQEHLPDLLFDAQAASAAAKDHLASCTSCRTELEELQATMALMDAWTVPEPSAFFDTRVKARLRSEQGREAQGIWYRVAGMFHFGTGRVLRPATAALLGLGMLLGGGTAATWFSHHWSAPGTSPTVNDLKIYDNNAQAVDQMDVLDDAGGSGDGMPQS